MPRRVIRLALALNGFAVLNRVPDVLTSDRPVPVRLREWGRVKRRLVPRAQRIAGGLAPASLLAALPKVAVSLSLVTLLARDLALLAVPPTTVEVP